VSEQDRGPVLLPEPRDRGLHLRRQLLRHDAVVGRLLVGLQGERRRLLPLGGDRIRRAVDRDGREVPSPEVIHGQVVGDLEQPGGELVRRVVAVEVIEGADEDLLREVLRELAVPDHPADEGEHGSLEPVDQLARGPLVAAPAEADELLVALLAVVHVGPTPSSRSPGAALPHDRLPPYRGRS
jgi:hypothetical protein